MSSDDPKGVRKGGCFWDPPNLVVFWECGEGIFCDCCLLGRTFHSHPLVYRLIGGQLQKAWI